MKGVPSCLVDSSNVLEPANPRFPGSQPVSFGSSDLNKLEQLECVLLNALASLTLSLIAPCRNSYWVCEKSDGIRVLFFIQTDHTGQTTYIVRLKPSPRMLPVIVNKDRSTGTTRIGGLPACSSLITKTRQDPCGVQWWTGN
jgi:hypothetical protein